MKKFIILSLISVLGTNNLFPAALGRNTLNTGLRAASLRLTPQLKAPVRAFSQQAEPNELFEMFDSTCAIRYKNGGSFKKYIDSIKNDPETYVAFKEWEKVISSDSQDFYYDKFDKETKNLDEAALNGYVKSLSDREVVHFSKWRQSIWLSNFSKGFAKYFAVTFAAGLGIGYYTLDEKTKRKITKMIIAELKKDTSKKE